MEKIKTLAEYQQLAARTCPDLGSAEANFEHMDLGIKTEVAEALDMFKKHFAYGKPFDAVNLGEELADQIWYRANYARLLMHYDDGQGMMSIKLQEAWETNQFFEAALGDISSREDLIIASHRDVISILDSHTLGIIQQQDNVFNKALGIPEIATCKVICDYYGIDFWQMLTNNIAKLKIRYPDKFNQESALNRNLEAERAELEKTGVHDGMANANQNDPGDQQEEKVFDVWTEGYAATGERSGAMFHGKFRGATFREAVLGCLKTFSDPRDLFSEHDGKMFYWGCQFFDNEADARKSFG